VIITLTTQYVGELCCIKLMIEVKYMDDIKAIGAIATAVGTSAGAGAGAISIATITSSAPGILGVIGFTTTTTVALSITGVVAVAGLVGYGLYKGVQKAQTK
jgi:hypothetical protein